MILTFTLGLLVALCIGIKRAIDDRGAEVKRRQDARLNRVTIDQIKPANDTGEGESIERALAHTEDLKERAVQWFIDAGETRGKAIKIVNDGYRGFIPGGSFQQLLIRCIRNVKVKQIKQR